MIQAMGAVDYCSECGADILLKLTERSNSLRIPEAGVSGVVLLSRCTDKGCHGYG